jgi:hypothetical protein
MIEMIIGVAIDKAGLKRNKTKFPAKGFIREPPRGRDCVSKKKQKQKKARSGPEEKKEKGKKKSLSHHDSQPRNPHKQLPNQHQSIAETVPIVSDCPLHEKTIHG